MLVCSEQLRTETAFSTVVSIVGLLLFVDGVWPDTWICWHIPALGQVQVTSWPSALISSSARGLLAFSVVFLLVCLRSRNHPFMLRICTHSYRP